MPTPHIVVLGAGYTGLTTAKLLARRTGATVTLVNERDWFVERCATTSAPPASGCATRGCAICCRVPASGWSSTARRTSTLGGAGRAGQRAEPVGYDLLVYALGSHADLNAVPDAATHAHAIAGAEQARAGCATGSPPRQSRWSAARPTGIETPPSWPRPTPTAPSGWPPAGPWAWCCPSAAGSTCTSPRPPRHPGAGARQGGRVTADGLLLEGGEHIDADAVA